MQYRVLGKTSLKISEIGYGTWGLGGDSYGPVDDSNSIRCLRKAFDLGVNFFDTSDLYGSGHSEEIIGEAFNSSRSDVIIATKVGLLPHSGFYMPQDLSSEYIKKAIDSSLQRLKTDYVDLYQLHSPEVDYLINHPEVFRTLDELRQDGKIRHIGLSARSPKDALMLLNLYPFESVQVNFNLIDHRALDDGLFDKANSDNIGIIARTPLCFGYLAGTLSGKKDFVGQDHRSNWPEEQLQRWAKAPGLFNSLIERRRVTPAQFALAYCLSHNAVSTTVPGMMNSIDITENLAAASMSILKQSEIDEIKKIYLENTFYDPNAKLNGRQ